MRKLLLRSIRSEALDIRSFEFTEPCGAALPPFEAGSHVDVHLPGGLVRQYSLCNGPDDHYRYVVAVKREPQSRGGSRAMHELTEGDLISVGLPRNSFSLDSSAIHHVLLAGGIGVTPMLSMTQQLLARGASFELHYFTRSPEHTAFRQLLAGPKYGGAVEFHYGYAPEVLSAFLQRALCRRNNGAHLYTCGPRPFMDLVEEKAADSWPENAVHKEYFAADASAAAIGGCFEVRLAHSGRTLTIPAGKTIIEVLSDAGVQISTSCEQGLCGSCVARVLDGIPDHRDVALSDEDRADGLMTLCVSRAKTRFLVLDL